MKKYFKLIMLILLFFLTSFKKTSESTYVLMEASSNRILESNFKDRQMLIASTTKILTAIVVIENYDIDEEIIIENSDCNIEGSKIYLEPTDKVKRRDLLYGLLLRSGNDAAEALSDNNSIDFIYKMNDYAKKIKMTNSVFNNASGLDETVYNLSTAEDMAKLMIYAMKNDTFREICGSKNHKFTSNNGKSYYFSNKHKLITSGDVIAGKTGYTMQSGRVLVSYFSRNNTEFVIVTINDSNDWKHHKDLINKTDEYEYKVVCKKGIYETNFDVDYYLFVPKDILLPIETGDNKVELVFILNNYEATLYIFIDDELVSNCLIDTSPIG